MTYFHAETVTFEDLEVANNIIIHGLPHLRRLSFPKLRLVDNIKKADPADTIMPAPISIVGCPELLSIDMPMLKIPGVRQGMMQIEVKNNKKLFNISMPRLGNGNRLIVIGNEELQHMKVGLQYADSVVIYNNPKLAFDVNDFFSVLVDVRKIDMSMNALYGELPTLTKTGHFESLTSLLLSDNQLTTPGNFHIKYPPFPLLPLPFPHYQDKIPGTFLTPW